MTTKKISKDCFSSHLKDYLNRLNSSFTDDLSKKIEDLSDNLVKFGKMKIKFLFVVMVVVQQMLFT